LLPAIAPLRNIWGIPGAATLAIRAMAGFRILAFLSFVVNKKYAVPRTPEKYHQEEQLHFDL
jgi:hypothetical protein